MSKENYEFHFDGTLPENGEIFVFGSNLGGRHGAGAAKVAMQAFGAKYGIGKGFVGQSYAIPTKDENFNVLPVETIQEYVNEFIEFANEKPEVKFFLTRVGCGLAGYDNKDIAPLFSEAPENCDIPVDWANFLAD